MKFSIKDFFGNCDQIRSFLHGKLYFLCSVCMELLMEKVFFFFARKARLQMFNSQKDYFVSLTVLLKTKEKLKKKNIRENKS